VQSTNDIDALTDDSFDDPPESHGCRPPLWAIIGLLIIMVGALFLGIQLFRVLFGLVFPEDPPIPPNAVETSHESVYYGVDDWRYETELNPCELARFYEDEGAVCVIQEGLCADESYHSPGYTIESVATCSGRKNFAGFGMLYDLTIGIHSRRGADEQTYFNIRRETLWGGPPRPTSTPGASE
jgi:hypothetical protein